MDKSKLMHFDIKILGLVWKSARDIIQEKAGPIKELSVNGHFLLKLCSVYQPKLHVRFTL